MRAVRQQAGVVVQNRPGFSREHLPQHHRQLDRPHGRRRVGGGAHRGLDEDIRAMPMGMQTMISRGNATFSGGQRQRLLIARAVAARAAHPAVRRGDERARQSDRRRSVTASLERLRRDADRDRSPALDDPRRRPDPGARRRSPGPVRHLRRAGREPGTVCRPRAQAAGVAWHASAPHPTSRNRLGPGRAAPRSRHSRRTRSSSSARLTAKGSRPGSTRRGPPVGATT